MGLRNVSGFEDQFLKVGQRLGSVKCSWASVLEEPPMTSCGECLKIHQAISSEKSYVASFGNSIC